MVKTKRYLLKLWYLGTHFSGSQRQPNRRTVEGELLRALKQIEYIHSAKDGFFKAAGRTDAGVHAREAGFCFNSIKPFYVRLLDSRLPDDMGITAWTGVPLDFHPRWEATLKEYRYIYPRIHHQKLDLDLIKIGLQRLQGQHDFKLFSKTDYSKPDKLTVLNLEYTRLCEFNSHLVFIFRARAFLWQQIRRTVRFLIKLGKHEVDLEDLDAKLDKKNQENPKIRRNQPVSPQGLILWSMEFNGINQFQTNLKMLERKHQFLQKAYFRTQQQASSLATLFQDSQNQVT